MKAGGVHGDAAVVIKEQRQDDRPLLRALKESVHRQFGVATGVCQIDQQIAWIIVIVLVAKIVAPVPATHRTEIFIIARAFGIGIKDDLDRVVSEGFGVDGVGHGLSFRFK